MQHVNSNAHDGINKGKHCTFGDEAGCTGFIQRQAQQSLHGLQQAQVASFLAAGEKERAQCAGNVVTALLKRQKDIPAHDNGGMADDAIKIAQLGFPFEVEVMLHHLEEDLKIPAL